GWISAQEYKEGLALAQLAPGPLAAQLAMYLGWVRARRLGATLVALAFVGPSFLMVLVLSVLYVRFGGLPWMQGLFYGIAAAVIAIIARSVLKLVRMTLGRDLVLWMLFTASALVTAWTESEIIWVFLLCGLVPMLLRGRQTAPATPALALLPVAPGLATGPGAPASVRVLLSPHFHRVAKSRQVKAFVDGVTAAATGAIAGAAVILGRRSLLDLPTILIALVTLALLLAPKKIPEPLLIVAAGLVGLVLKGAAPWP